MSSSSGSNSHQVVTESKLTAHSFFEVCKNSHKAGALSVCVSWWCESGKKKSLDYKLDVSNCSSGVCLLSERINLFSGNFGLFTFFELIKTSLFGEESHRTATQHVYTVIIVYKNCFKLPNSSSTLNICVTEMRHTRRHDNDKTKKTWKIELLKKLK